MKFIFALFVVLSVLVGVKPAETTRPYYVDANEALLLRDAAVFFGSPNPFRDRREANNFIVRILPLGMSQSEAKKRISALIERLEPEPRQHIAISFSAKTISVSCWRFFDPESPIREELTVSISFDSEHKRSGSLVPSLAFESWNGPPISEMESPDSVR
jgi:hypothetical protein